MKTWTGYAEKISYRGLEEIKYSVELSDEKFAELWQRFKAWKGSQKDFYFKYVNPAQLREMPADAKKRISIKTKLKGGKRE